MTGNLDILKQRQDEIQKQIKLKELKKQQEIIQQQIDEVISSQSDGPRNNAVSLPVIRQETYKGRVINLVGNEYKINDIVGRFPTINDAKIFIDTLADERYNNLQIQTNKQKSSGAAILLIGLVTIFAIGTWLALSGENSPGKTNSNNLVSSENQNANDRLVTKNDVENFYIDYRQVREDLRNGENYIVEGTGYEIMLTLGAFVNKRSDGYYEIVLVKSDRSSIFPVWMKVDCENYRLKIRKPDANDYDDDFKAPNRGSNGEAFVALACRLPFAYLAG